MNRRELNRAALAALLVATYERALALELSSGEASAGLKAALEKGANAAVALLGRPDGFLGNPQVRIALPGFLESGAKLLKTLGQGKRVDELVTSLNRAAETAVPMGKDLLVGAVRDMSVGDARKILKGGPTGATDFFAEKTRAPLSQKFLPVITQATEKVGLARQYNEFAAKASGAGLLKKEDANIEQYVTGKTLSGLYLVIGEEEKKIRRDPVAAGSDLLKKVFGALK
jgi:hypothetical protein